jgi:hypothetical protein
MINLKIACNFMGVYYPNLAANLLLLRFFNQSEPSFIRMGFVHLEDWHSLIYSK